MIRKATAKKKFDIAISILLLVTMILSILPIAPPVPHVSAAPVVTLEETISLPLSYNGGTTYHTIYQMTNTANGMRRKTVKGYERACGNRKITRRSNNAEFI